jgi:hypothetical protein
MRAARRSPSAHRFGALDLAAVELHAAAGPGGRAVRVSGQHGQMLRGFAFDVVEPSAYRPAAAAFALIAALEKSFGRALWDFPGSRPNFMQTSGHPHAAPPWPASKFPSALLIFALPAGVG